MPWKFFYLPWYLYINCHAVYLPVSAIFLLVLTMTVSYWGHSVMSHTPQFYIKLEKSFMYPSFLVSSVTCDAPAPSFLFQTNLELGGQITHAYVVRLQLVRGTLLRRRAFILNRRASWT